jgi:ATP-dependent DNA helicase RecG
MTRKALQESLALKGEDNFRKLYLTPALELSALEMTIPDKPNSRSQKYRLTNKGRALLRAMRSGRKTS